MDDGNVIDYFASKKKRDESERLNEAEGVEGDVIEGYTPNKYDFKMALSDGQERSIMFKVDVHGSCCGVVLVYFIMREFQPPKFIRDLMESTGGELMPDQKQKMVPDVITSYFVRRRAYERLIPQLYMLRLAWHARRLQKVITTAAKEVRENEPVFKEMARKFTK